MDPVQPAPPWEMAELPPAERLARELNALTEVAKTLARALELPELLHAALQTIITVLEPAQVGTVMLWDRASGLFRSTASIGFDEEALKQLGLQAGESITGKVYDDGRAVLLCTPEDVNQAMADMRPANRQVFARAAGTDSLPTCVLAAPITAGNQRFGVLVIETLAGHERFTEQDLPFLQTLADLIALAIDRARLELLADAVREQRQEERLRSELMAILSHELRHPLTAIKGYSTALLMEDITFTPEQTREFLESIDSECDIMQTMISEILDSSLIDVDQLNIQREPMRLPQLVQDVAAESQRRTSLHRMVIDFPPEFPIVEADPHWIRQVLRNVLDNAIKYSPEGGLIVVRGEVRPADVVISVADQGLGISPEDIILLFVRYYRVKMSNGYHIPGTGLGLPIARTIVEAHGGRIWVESKVGQGTTLFFSLPKTTLPPDKE